MREPFNLSDEAELELYHLYDKHVVPLIKKEDGTIDKSKNDFSNNLLDAMRHAYVSGVFTMEYGEDVANAFGRLNELIPFLSQGRDSKDINMDLWNNAVGQKYGKKAKNRDDLFKLLLDAQKNEELIENNSDKRKYNGDASIKKRPKGLVIVIEESKTGENLTFYDLDNKKVLSKGDFVVSIKGGGHPDYEIRQIGGKETPVSKKDRFNFNNLG